MSFENDYNFETIINEAEKLVIGEIEKQFSNDQSACRCEDCVLDTATLALNMVKPQYRVSLLGSLYASSPKNTEQREEIRAAVSKAMEIVKNNPSH